MSSVPTAEELFQRWRDFQSRDQGDAEGADVARHTAGGSAASRAIGSRADGWIERTTDRWNELLRLEEDMFDCETQETRRDIKARLIVDIAQIRSLLNQLKPAMRASCRAQGEQDIHPQLLYKFVEMLGGNNGCGGTNLGDVSRQRSRLNGEFVCVKRTDRRRLLRPGVIEDPYNELGMLKLFHRNKIEGVVKLKEFMLTRDHLIVVMELCEADLLVKLNGQSITVEDKKNCFRQIVESIRRIHGLGYCHLDLKNENIFVQGERVVIGDFGMCMPKKSTSQSQSSTSSTASPQTRKTPVQVFERRGTFAFMDPSMLLLPPPWDGFKADIYSLGVILYTLLILNFPYETKRYARNRRDAYNQKDFKLIYKGGCDQLIARLDREGKLRSAIDPQAVDLIRRILVPPERRLSIEEILAHPWLATSRGEGRVAPATVSQGGAGGEEEQKNPAPMEDE